MARSVGIELTPAHARILSLETAGKAISDRMERFTKQHAGVA